MGGDAASKKYQVRALTRGLAVLSRFTPESPRHSLADLLYLAASVPLRQAAYGTIARRREAHAVRE
jgi:hypothetical protein